MFGYIIVNKQELKFREFDVYQSYYCGLCQSLKDRFGKIPKEGKELIRIVRLRRMAKKLGMEKVILKKGQMSLFLVNNPDSPYYQSEAFGKLLGFIQKHPRECNLREQNGKRSIVIKNVPTVEAACGYLQEMEKINSTNF